MSSGALQQASTTGDQHLAQEEEWRRGTYSLLGRVLAAPPEPDLLRQLAIIEAGDPADQGLAGAWARLALAAAEAESPADEFHALFIGLGRGELLPYASWYRTGFLMERPLAEVRASLERLGIERQDSVAEPEDHIGALCETMAILIGDAGISDADERDFFSAHLAPWWGRFFTDLENARAARFYRSVGRLGSLFTELEERCLSGSA